MIKKQTFKLILTFVFSILCLLQLENCKRQNTKTQNQNQKIQAEITRFALTQKNGVVVEGTILKQENRITLDVKGDPSDFEDITPEISWIGAGIVPADNLPQDFTKEVSYTISTEYKTSNIIKVTTTITPFSEIAQINSFQIKQPSNDAIVTATITDLTDEEGTIELELFARTITDYKHIVPTIGFEGFTISPSPDSEIDLRFPNNPVHYVVTAENGKTKTYTVIANITPLAYIEKFELEQENNLGKAKGTFTTDMNSKIVFITLNLVGDPDSDYYKKLTPEVGIIGNGVMDPDGDREQDFTNDIDYTVCVDLDVPKSCISYVVQSTITPLGTCEIYTIEELKDISLSFANNPYVTCTLETGLDLKGETLPSITSFRGIFDGKNNIIQNFKSDNSLFTKSRPTLIKDLILEGIDYNNSNTQSSVLIDHISDGDLRIENVHIKNLRFNNNFSNNQVDFGAIVGATSDTKLVITKSSVNNIITNTQNQNSFVGGFIGRNSGNSSEIRIEESYFDGEIAGLFSRGGGFLGHQNSGSVTIINSYTQGTINFNNAYIVGGFIGESYATPQASIENSYMAMNIISNNLINPYMKLGNFTWGMSPVTINFENIFYYQDFLATNITINSPNNFTKIGTALDPTNLNIQNFINWNFNTIWQWQSTTSWPTLQNNP